MKYLNNFTLEVSIIEIYILFLNGRHFAEIDFFIMDQYLCQCEGLLFS